MATRSIEVSPDSYRGQKTSAMLSSGAVRNQRRAIFFHAEHYEKSRLSLLLSEPVPIFYIGSEAKKVNATWAIGKYGHFTTLITQISAAPFFETRHHQAFPAKKKIHYP